MSFFSEIKKGISKVTKFVAGDILDDVLGYEIPQPTRSSGGPLGMVLGNPQLLEKVLGMTVAEARAKQGLAAVPEPVEPDVPTASYLETQEYLGMQRQKALVKGITGSGIVSKEQGREMARPPAAKPINFSLIVIIAIVIWGLKL